MARSHVLSRILVVILTALTGWIGLMQPAAVSAAQSVLLSITFACDCGDHAGVLLDATTERGPPNATYDYTTYNADGLVSPGVSARSADATTRAICDYDDLACHSVKNLGHFRLVRPPDFRSSLCESASNLESACGGVDAG